MTDQPTNESGALSRRTFLATGSAAALGLVTGGKLMAQEAAPLEPAAPPAPPPAAVFTPSELPYPVGALEPVIDTMTMTIHYGKHHAGYARKLNATLAQDTQLAGISIEELLSDINGLPEGIRTAVRNNGGGFYNHSLFWSVMSPEGGEPGEELAAAIDRDLGGYDAMVSAFSKAAGTRFGSGWAWLVVQPNGILAVGSTPNQDNPLMEGVSDLVGQPILGLDVWEHAYYLKYQNRRGDYVKNWWQVVNWKKVDELYHQSIN